MKHTCKNCFQIISSGDNYCPHCGQSAATDRLHFKLILHDFLHALYHADKGFFMIARQLALNPGRIALNYVNGQRKRYFNPFNFLLIIAAVFLFLSMHFNTLDPLQNDPQARFLEKHSNLILIFSLPLLALLSWIFFKQSKKNFSECLVLCCYLLGEMYLFYNLVCTPLILAFRNNYQIIILGYGLIWLLYFSYGAVVFFEDKTWKGILKAILVIVIFQFFTGLIGLGIYHFIHDVLH